MNRLTAMLLCAVLMHNNVLFAGLGGHSAQYVGGTLKTKPETEFKEVLTDGDSFRLVSKKESIEIPYESIESLEFGQKVGRRIGSAVALGVFTMGIGGLLALSKKRRHYLSITFKDAAGENQGAVIELGKEITRPVLKTLEIRTGKEVEYESEESKQNTR